MTETFLQCLWWSILWEELNRKDQNSKYIEKKSKTLDILFFSIRHLVWSFICRRIVPERSEVNFFGWEQISTPSSNWSTCVGSSEMLERKLKVKRISFSKSSKCREQRNLGSQSNSRTSHFLKILEEFWTFRYNRCSCLGVKIKNPEGYWKKCMWNSETAPLAESSKHRFWEPSGGFLIRF